MPEECTRNVQEDNYSNAVHEFALLNAWVHTSCVIGKWVHTSLGELMHPLLFARGVTISEINIAIYCDIITLYHDIYHDISLAVYFSRFQQIILM